MSIEVTLLHNYTNTPVTDNSFHCQKLLLNWFLGYSSPRYKYCVPSNWYVISYTWNTKWKKCSFQRNLCMCFILSPSSAFLDLMIRLYSDFVLFLYTFSKSSKVDFSLNLIGFAVLTFLNFQKQTYKHFSLCSF